MRISGNGTLTPMVIQRIFQEYNTYSGEMVRSRHHHCLPSLLALLVPLL